MAQRLAIRNIIIRRVIVKRNHFIRRINVRIAARLVIPQFIEEPEVAVDRFGEASLDTDVRTLFNTATQHSLTLLPSIPKRQI